MGIRTQLRPDPQVSSKNEREMLLHTSTRYIRKIFLGLYDRPEGRRASNIECRNKIGMVSSMQRFNDQQISQPSVHLRHSVMR